MARKRSPTQASTLGEYRRRRDFAHTPEPAEDTAGGRTRESSPEPAGGAAGEHGAGGRTRESSPEPAGGAAGEHAQARFVVQEHHARRLHWDLRLEHDGVLLSWAIPNGIPQDPRENRKAIHVEDHPLSYLDFEGTIPRGSYGAGKVVIFDRGTYEAEKLRDDELIVVFHGQRVRGRYALFRTGSDEDWMIHRMDPPERALQSMPEHLAPMLATPGQLPVNDDGWGYEIKWDGVRAILYSRPGHLRIESRNLNEITARYPELRALGRQLGAHEAVLDGEIVAFDEHGAPSFERLQQRMNLTSESEIRRLARTAPVTYVIFDLLHLDGQLTAALPYRERRELLEALELNGPAWQTPANHLGSGREFLAVTAEHHLEGVVAKRLDSPYLPGARSRNWLKVKNSARQELVIGGWLPGKGRRARQIGALLMGYYERQGRSLVLRYAGRVGTGFDERELERLVGELASRERSQSPFAEVGAQPPRNARFVDPELVAEVAFTDWTRERLLRQPSYKGLRTDKTATDLRIELPAKQGSTAIEAARKPVAPRARARAAKAHDARKASARAGGSGSADAPAGRPYRVLRESADGAEIEVQGRALRLTNRDKLMYPASGFTKGQLVDYYAAVAPVLLGHLAARPLTLKRYPDGVDGEFFYEKRCPAHRPDWVQTAPVWSEDRRERIDYCLADDLPTLIWLANLADIELHTSLSRAPDLDIPTSLVFDLDPGAPAGIKECCRVALWIRELFDTLELVTVAKTSGAKGLHVHLPLNTHVTYTQTKPLARAVAELLAREHPKLVVSDMRKRLRDGRVLIDWSQNDGHKTTVSVYSLRARQEPTISTPLSWEEVAQAARRRREQTLSARPDELLARVEREGDLYAPMLTLSQTLPELA